jgi:hypothetical protein
VVGNTLQWTAPAWGGGTIASYSVAYRPVGQTSWGVYAKGANLTSVVLDAGGAGSACSAANAGWSDCYMPYGWDPFTQYEFAVFSRSDAGKNSMGPLTAADTAFGIYGFESDAQGWTAEGGTTVASDATVVSEGTHSLRVDNEAGFTWLKSPWASAADISSNSALKVDVKNTAAFDVNVRAVSNGASWCDRPNTGYVPAGTTRTVVVDLSGCGGLTSVSEVWLAITNKNGGSNAGTFYLDNVRFQPKVPVLFGFESDTDDWGGTNATVAQTTAFHTEGSTGLEAVVTGGGYGGSEFSSSVPLTGNLTQTPLVTLDVKNVDANEGWGGSNVMVGVKSGGTYTWCTGPMIGVGAGGSRTITIDLSAIPTGTGSCASKNLADVKGIMIQTGTNGTFIIDNVRVEALG